MHWHQKKQEYWNQEAANCEKYSDGVGTYGKAAVGEVMDVKICRLSPLVLRLEDALKAPLERVFGLPNLFGARMGTYGDERPRPARGT
jgi:hypothetical protein